MDYTEFCVEIDAPVVQVMDVIERTHMQAVVVVEEGLLKGTVTDGDVRRYLLRNSNINVPVQKVMCTRPICLLESERDCAVQCMKDNRIKMVPIVNASGKVVDIIFDSEYIIEEKVSQDKLNNVSVVIMAGGKGKRLLPYTAILPKPLMPIAGKTVLEHIIESFSQYGCNKFFLTLNYKKEIIKAYLTDINMPCEINYVEEKKYLGTAGSLSLIKNSLNSTFIVSNCDILLNIDYAKLVAKHHEEENQITLVLLHKEYTIPYGVVDIYKNGRVIGLREKPHLDFKLNTGMYIIEPNVIEKMEERFMDMTELIEYTLACGKKIGSYLIDEDNWIDIGEINGLNRANEG